MRKEATFQIRCTEEQLAAWREAARSQEMSLSVWARFVLSKVADQHKETAHG